MLKKIPFTTKLFLSIIAITIFALFITSWSSLRMATGGLVRLSEKGIIATHSAVYESVKESYKLLQPKLEEDIELFSLLIRARGTLFIDRESVTHETITEQKTGMESSVDIPAMLLNGTSLLYDNTLIDEAARHTKTDLTLFQLVDGKLLRIATTIKKNGKRATGTYIPSSDPVFQTIARGETFTGKSFVVNEEFVTRYRPLKDSTGNIIGAIFAGRPLMTSGMKEILKKSKIGESYFFVYTSEGVVLEHPTFIGLNIFEHVPEFKGKREGFIRYDPRVDGQHKRLDDKVSYIKYFEPADIFIVLTMFDKDVLDGIDSRMIRNNFLLGIVLLALAIVLTYIIVRSINRPLQELAEKTAQVGQGDYLVEFESESKDAIGLLTRSLGQMVDNGKAALLNIKSSSESLAVAASQLTALSKDMLENADQTTQIANDSADNFTVVSDNMNSISSAMEESTINLDTIASASEEMGNTIQEIASNSARARQTTEEAVTRAKRSHSDVQKLGEAAKSIGSITETITEISEQTNLLALNATIEAARAGEAGKGFAVVANEIKDLAKGTAEATGKIRSAIETIQTQTNGTVEDISQIESVIENVSDIVTTIVTAVEEQSITTNEIVGNVAQASQGIGEINENVASSSEMTVSVTEGINNVKERSTSVKINSEQVSSSATELASLAEKLTELVKRFKIER